MIKVQPIKKINKMIFLICLIMKIPSKFFNPMIYKKNRKNIKNYLIKNQAQLLKSLKEGSILKKIKR